MKITKEKTNHRRKYSNLLIFQKKVLYLHENDIIRVTTMSLKSNSEAKIYR